MYSFDMIFQTSEKYEQALLSTLLYIQTHLEGDLNLETLAKHVGFSPYHFHRVFRENVGEPVKEYIRRLRLERAAYRLRVSEEAILRIALESGFKSHESFTRAFERQFNITPNHFRNNSLRASQERKKQIAPQYLAGFNFKKRVWAASESFHRKAGSRGTCPPDHRRFRPSRWRIRQPAGERLTHVCFVGGVVSMGQCRKTYQF